MGVKDAAQKNRLTLPMLIQSVCFGLYFFAFQLIEFTVNDRAELLLGAEKVNAVYSVGIACTALGFLSFSALRRLFSREAARKTALCFAGALFLLSSVSVICSQTSFLFLASAFMALFFIGHIGGCVYYTLAMTYQGSDCLGRAVGTAAAAAVLLQFAVQNLFLTEAAFIACITLSVLLLLWFVIKPPRDWMFENPLPFSSENKTDRKLALTLIVSAAPSLPLRPYRQFGFSEPSALRRLWREAACCPLPFCFYCLRI